MKIANIIENIISEYGKRVTQNMWKKMSDDEKENALLTIFKDPDDRRFEDFLFSDWNKLPGWARRDMRTEGKLKENKSAMDIRDQVKMADKVAKKHGLTKAKKYRGVGFYWWLEIKDYPTGGMQDKLGRQMINRNYHIAMKQVEKAAREMEKYMDDVKWFYNTAYAHKDLDASQIDTTDEEKFVRSLVLIGEAKIFE